jgi:hypothetical protein
VHVCADTKIQATLPFLSHYKDNTFKLPSVM